MSALKRSGSQARLNGTADKPYSALQAHVTFFDRDGDGIIWPLDTYLGFREIGFNILLSVLSVFIIHLGFSYLTWGTWLPDPFFRLRVDQMHKGKHGSDSESYTQFGDLDEWRFRYIFEAFSAQPHTHMSFTEGVRMVNRNRNPLDPFGWSAAIFEWGATYLLFWPEDGRLSRDEVRGVLDGSVFYKLAGRPMPKDTHGVYKDQ